MSLISRQPIKGSRKGVRGRDHTGGLHGWWVGGGDRDCRGSPLGWVAGDVTPKISREKIQDFSKIGGVAGEPRFPALELLDYLIIKQHTFTLIGSTDLM